MDHGHEHHGHDHGAGDYYLEQLLTLFMCGAFGLVAVLMNQYRMLNLILAPEFHNWVLAGGIVLLAFTAVRAVALWQSAGKQAHHDHAHDNHEHGPECDHGHHHHDHAHAHDDGHSHGNIFWRLVVLAFPLMLFLLGLPNEGFSKEWVERRLGKDSAIEVADVEAEGGSTVPMEFHTLNEIATDPDKRAVNEGRTVRKGS